MKSIENKIALVTGSSRSLGREMALRLAEAGTDVIVTYLNNHEKALDVVKEIQGFGQKGIALQLNVSDLEQQKTFFDQLKRSLQQNWNRESFDFLVNNAGIGIHAMTTETTEEQFDSLLNVHFKGAYFLTQKAIPLLAEGGRIINISTGLTRFAIPGYGAYASMKGAMEIFTKYLAKELGEKKITANLVAPGAIGTDFNRAAFDHNPGMVDMLSNVTALGRVGIAEDIGGVVTFLCSEAGRWINAQRIEASGGMFL